jgi:myo-inositol-1(or 4)-monophosphatase
MQWMHAQFSGGDTAAELTALRGTAVRVAREVAELVRQYRAPARRFTGRVQTKSSETDVVTEADRAAETRVRERLGALRPGEPVLGEEHGGPEAPGSAELQWVVDPIDGTVNFLYGYPAYAVSLAVQRAGVSVAGAVVEPVTGRTWSAARGHGATLDEVPLAASGATRLDLALVGTGFAYQADRRARQADAVAELLRSVRDIRRGGSAALELCAVAAGWLDAYWEHGLERWDWAAGALVAEEAGAVVRRPETAGGLTVASAPGIASELGSLLRQIGAERI